MSKDIQDITVEEWDVIARMRIQSLSVTWEKLNVDERFWIVLNWLKEYRVVQANKAKKQLFICQPYWLLEYIVELY